MENAIVNRRPGKAWASFLAWTEQVRQNKRVLVYGPHYVVVSREVWDEMTNKPLGLAVVEVDGQVP